MLGDDVSIAFIRDAMLLTAELVTAATTTDSCTFNASFDGVRLRVEIADLSPDVPAVDAHAAVPDDEPRLVNTIASCSGASVFGSRAAVWFELNQQAYRTTPPDPWR